jgi:mannose-6-phosphate isomerase-like protein (cupin superfamily)
MCLQPGEEIGDEAHQNVDRFLRIEQGHATLVINISKTAPLKLSTLYAPPNHPEGTVHQTMAEAEAAEAVLHT